MAWADTRTLIPLDRVAYHLGIDPYHFNGIVTSHRPAYESCDDIWFQYDYQNAGKVSRESLANALRQAEQVTIRQLNWFPVLDWVTEEEVHLPTHYRPETTSLYNALGKPKSLLSGYGYVYALGKKTKTLVQEDVPIVFVDHDGDGFKETAQVSVPTDVTDPEELYIYFTGTNGADTSEIRPVKSIEITEGVATIEFPRYLVPLRTLVSRMVDVRGEPLVINGDDPGNYEVSVDVYRVWTDPSQQVTFYYTPVPCDGPCTESTQTGCMTIKDSRLGLLTYQTGTWDEKTGTYTNLGCTIAGRPVRTTINYRAGLVNNDLPMPTRQMSPEWERAIVYYALTFLDTEVCGCSNTHNIWKKQIEDRSRNTRDGSYTLPYALLHNPFGTTTAAIHLYSQVHADGVRRVIPPLTS
jgi:hypothetical protein